MRKIKQQERPYNIRYMKAGRTLYDSATTLEFAIERINLRAKKVKGEHCQVWNGYKLVYDTREDHDTNDTI